MSRTSRSNGGTMLERRGTVVAVATGALVAALAPMAPSNAEDLTTYDPARDVITYDDEGAATRTPRIARLDVTRFTTKYSADRLKLTTKVRLLKRADWSAAWRVKSPTRDDIFLYDPEQEQVLRTPESAGRSEERGVGACVPRVSLDRDRDTISLVLRDGCLAGARWVRTGSSMQDESGPYYGDDARRDGAAGGPVKLGQKRVHPTT